MRTHLFLPLALAAAVFTSSPAFAQSISELIRQGNAAQEARDFSGAEQIFRRAITMDGNNINAYLGLGNALDQQRNGGEEAVTAYGNVIRLDPNNANGYYNLGLAFKNQGKLAEAIASYQSAIRLDPNFANAYNNLGNALSDQGRLEEAIANYRTAGRIAPNNRLFQNNLRAVEQLLVERQRTR